MYGKGSYVPPTMDQVAQMCQAAYDADKGS